MEFDVYLQFVLALVLVLALIGGLAWVARRFGFGGQLIPNAGKSPRLFVVEVKVLDPRRKLVLLRRDGCEHLVLLGPNQDLLLESAIQAPRDAADPARASVHQTEAPAGKIPEVEMSEVKMPEAKRQLS
jgi:flagellar protein FliO/FliZ